VFTQPAEDAFLPLYYWAGTISGFSAEPHALVYGLEWCHSYLKSCHFQSALFLTVSQLTLALLFTALVFLLPKFWDIWDLSYSLSSRVPLSLQWVPGYAGLSGKETFKYHMTLQRRVCSNRQSAVMWPWGEGFGIPPRPYSSEGVG